MGVGEQRNKIFGSGKQVDESLNFRGTRCYKKKRQYWITENNMGTIGTREQDLCLGWTLNSYWNTEQGSSYLGICFVSISVAYGFQGIFWFLQKCFVFSAQEKHLYTSLLSI